MIIKLKGVPYQIDDQDCAKIVAAAMRDISSADIVEWVKKVGGSFADPNDKPRDKPPFLSAFTVEKEKQTVAPSICGIHKEPQEGCVACDVSKPKPTVAASDPQYRMLEVGEVIREGDEWHSDFNWHPTSIVDGVTKTTRKDEYRRRIDPNDKSAPVDPYKELRDGVKNGGTLQGLQDDNSWVDMSHPYHPDPTCWKFIGPPERYRIKPAPVQESAGGGDVVQFLAKIIWDADSSRDGASEILTAIRDGKVPGIYAMHPNNAMVNAQDWENMKRERDESKQQLAEAREALKITEEAWVKVKKDLEKAEKIIEDYKDQFDRMIKRIGATNNIQRIAELEAEVAMLKPMIPSIGGPAWHNPHDIERIKDLESQLSAALFQLEKIEGRLSKAMEFHGCFSVIYSNNDINIHDTFNVLNLNETYSKWIAARKE